MDDRIFALPPDDCRGTDFWMLNDRLDDQELRRQLREMCRQGVRSIIVRTYIGLQSDYPGADWMQKMHVVVDEARQLGMTLFMQAGYMPEAVVNLPPEYSLGDVRAYPAGKGEGQLLDSHAGVDYCLVPSRIILDMLSKEAMDFYIRQSYADMWAEFRSEFGKTIISMWVDEPSYARVSLPWTKQLPDAFRELWGYDFPLGKLHLLYVDGDGDKALRHQFWRTVLHLIKTAYFQGVRDWCHANGLLFSGHLMAEDKMASQILATCFTMPLYKYFDIPGTDYLTADMNWRYGEIKPESGERANMWNYGKIITPLQCTSAAHQAGKEKILCEMYGVSTENLGLRDQKYMFDMFAAYGINHRSVHGIFYSLRGRGKRAYPPHVSDYQPYWPQYHHLTDTLARETWFVRQGKPQSFALLLHPMGSAFCEYHAKDMNGKQSNKEVQKRDAEFLELVDGLAALQLSFEMGDEDTISEEGSIAADGSFVLGQMKYSVVILPSLLTIQAGTVQLLNRFIAAGGHVYALGSRPALVDGQANATLADLERFEVVGDLRRLADILADAPQPYQYKSLDERTAVRILFRAEDENRLFFLANNDCREGRAGQLSVPGHCLARQYCPEDGSIRALACSYEGDSTQIPVALTAGGSLMISLVPGRQQAWPLTAACTKQISLRPSWNCRRRDPNALLLEMCRFACGDEPLSAKEYPILALQEILTARDYHGEIQLAYTFETRIDLSGIRLVLEAPEKQAIQLDGKPIANQADGIYLTSAFQTITLPQIAAGKHELTLRRWFEPLRKPMTAATSLFENLGGVELEQLLLIGDFTVTSFVEPGISGCVRVNPHFVLDREAATVGCEIVKDGYPFYAGCVSLTNEFVLGEADEKQQLRFSLDGIYASAAEVYINGIKAGDLNWEPYSVRVQGPLQAGINTIELRLFNSLRNLLGPWHRPAGEIGACWGGYSFPNLPWLGAVENGTVVSDWYEQRTPDRAGWTDSYLLLPLGFAGPHLDLITEG